MSLADEIKDMKKDIAALKTANVSSSPEVFDAILVPEQMEIAISDTLQDPTSQDATALYGTYRYGFAVYSEPP